MRNCYNCNKEINNIEGKYYCSKECWEKYGENFKKIPSRLTIKELQDKVLELGKSAPKSDIILTPEQIFG